MPGGRLTPKQEKFACGYVETNNASEAYRRAYDVGEATKPETIWSRACELLKNSKVAARVDGLHAEARERTMVTVESLTKELEEARKLGKKTDQSSAMTSATMGKAKLHGLLVEKTESKLEVTHDLDAATETLAAVLAARDARK